MATSNNNGGIGPSGAYRRQDGQILGRLVEHGEPHIQRRWDERCPDGWEGYNVRCAWREARPIKTVDNGSFRLHEETGLVLVSQFAFLQTTYRHPTAYDEINETDESDEQTESNQ